MSSAILITGIMNLILCLYAWKNQVYGKVLFPTLMNMLPINFISRDLKVQNYTRGILMLIIGKYAPVLLPKQLILRTNGMIMIGCKNERSIIVLMHHGVFTRCILQAG